jgi:general secretion pathway protein F
MPVFVYRARTTAGRGRGGIIDAESPRAAWQELRARGVYPTEVREQQPSARRSGRPRAAELAATTRQLAVLVGAGLPIAEALDAAIDEAVHPALQHALTLARARIREGESLADALAASPRVFPPMFRDLVRAGEASGALAPVLARLAEHTEASAALRERLRAALVYPAIMTAATGAVVLFLVFWVLPQVAELFDAAGTPLPLTTRALMATTSHAVATAWLTLPIGAVLTIALARWLATPAGRARLDAVVLRLPVIGPLARTAASARLARTLTLLLGGGVPLESALGIAGAGVGNRHLAETIARAREAVRQGEPFATALRNAGEFPPLLVRLAAAGEKTGTLAETTEKAAIAQEGELERKIATLTAMIEPTLIITMGLVVLILVTAILQPLLTMTSTVAR